MIHEEIIAKAYETYPKKIVHDCDGCEWDDNKYKREGYIKALEELNELPKIEGWVARDKDYTLAFYTKKPERDTKYWWHIDGAYPLSLKFFPDLTWDSEPRKVELIIREV